MVTAESSFFGKTHFSSLFRRVEEGYLVRVEPVVQKRVRTGELSPAKISLIDKSLNPRWNMGLVDIVSLGGLGKNFVCKTVAGENGEGRRAAFWLDPTKWQPTLNEFVQFIQSHSSRMLSFLVVGHEVDGAHEHVFIKPVMIDSWGIHESGFKYGLEKDGGLSLGRDEDGTSEVCDLGHVNPGRVIQAETAVLLNALGVYR